jgi:hypothetical protein
MIKKKCRSIQWILLVLLLLAGSTSVFAQQDRAPATIRWGDEYKEPSNSSLSKVIGFNRESIFVLREKQQTAFSKADKVYVEKYDRLMKLKRSKEIDLKYKGKKRDFEDIVMLGGKMILFTSFNNQAHKKNYLFAQEVESDRLLVGRQMTKIAESEARNKVVEGSFDIRVSRDSSKLLVYNQLPFKKKDPERFALRIFDPELNLLWNRNITLPYGDEMFSIEEYRIDNKGDVYLLGVLYEDRARVRRQGTPTYKYVVLAYRGGGEEVKEYKIDIGDRFITDLTFRIGNDGDLICSGFYSDRGTYSIRGTYFFRLDPESQQISNVNVKEFEFEFVAEYLSDRGKERAKRAENEGDVRRQAELYDYDLNDLVLRSDGGALLVAEQVYIYERTYRYFDGTWRSTFFYNYNDIIIVNIRPDGEIEWSARVPKRQATVDDGGYFSSYAMSIVRDKIYFVYNDNHRNFEVGGRNRIYNYNGSNSVISVAEVSKDGSVQAYPLFSNREAAIITRPKMCKQIGFREMLLYGERNRNYRFGSLVFD